jgi:hypothetical protein
MTMGFVTALGQQADEWSGESEIPTVVFAIPVILVFTWLAISAWKGAPDTVRLDLTKLLRAEQMSLDLDKGLLLEADLVRFVRISNVVGAVLGSAAMVASVAFGVFDDGGFGICVGLSTFAIGSALTRIGQAALVRRRAEGSLRSARLIDRDISRYLPRSTLVLQRVLIATVLAAASVLLLVGLTRDFTPELARAAAFMVAGVIMLSAIVFEQRQLTHSPAPSNDPDVHLLHDLRIGIGVWDAYCGVISVAMVVMLAALLDFPLVALAVGAAGVLVTWRCSGTRADAIWHFRSSEEVSA